MDTDTVYFVICHDCVDRIYIPANAIGPDRSDLYDVVSCPNCSTTFDYDSEEIKSMPLSDWQRLFDLENRS